MNQGSHRTQDNRYWVYIELYPQGDITGGRYLDLNMVDMVDFAYDKNPENPVDTRFCMSAVITYAGCLKPIELKNAPSIELWAAKWFHEKWTAYLKEKNGLTDDRIMEKAKPGLILLPDNFGPGMKVGR